MAKIKIDKTKCLGCGTCVALCPACFKLGKKNKAVVIKADCEECDVKEIVESCPVQAISVEGKD